jgi:hypothetical protein
MDKERMYIETDYILPEPEKIEEVILVLGNGGPYIMIHCEKTSFRIDLVSLNGVDSISCLDVLGQRLEKINYEYTMVLIKTDKQRIIID